MTEADFDVKEKDLGKILAQLLVGNVDRSMFDSGGVYGTSVGHHKEKVAESGQTAYDYFQSTKSCTFRVHEWSDGDVKLRWLHNLYWWLQEQDELDYSPEITGRFYDWIDFLYAHNNGGLLPDGKKVFTNYAHGVGLFFKYAHSFWPDTPQDWEDLPHDEWMSRYGAFRAWFDLKGADELVEEPHAGNTYNGDNMLSQDFQYVGIEYDGDYYVAVSIHGGCDARGGYGDSIIFTCDDMPYLYGSDGYISCDCCHESWDTYDGGYSIRHSVGSLHLTSEIIKSCAERNEEDAVTGRLLCPLCADGVLQP